MGREVDDLRVPEFASELPQLELLQMFLERLPEPKDRAAARGWLGSHPTLPFL